MKKLSENSILIAAFMGVKPSDELYKGHLTFIGEHLKDAGLPFKSFFGNCMDNLPFKTSWDWLMTVIDKIHLTDEQQYCITIDENNCKIWNETDKDFDIECVGFTTIEATYKAIVKFIKWFNKEQNICENCGFCMGEGYINCGASEDGICPECSTKQN